MVEADKGNMETQASLAKPNGVLARAVAGWLSSPAAKRQTMVNLLTLGVFVAWGYAGLTGNEFAVEAKAMALLLFGFKGGTMIANGNSR